MTRGARIVSTIILIALALSIAGICGYFGAAGTKVLACISFGAIAGDFIHTCLWKRY